MAQRINTDTAVKVGLAVGALLIAEQVLGIFTPDKPGGEVDPAPGDTRPATISWATAQTLAQRIANAVYGAVWQPWENDQAIRDALLACNVTADVQLLRNAYAERAGFFEPDDLLYVVAEYLDADYLAAVNATYQQRGITIQF